MRKKLLLLSAAALTSAASFATVNFQSVVPFEDRDDCVEVKSVVYSPNKSTTRSDDESVIFSYCQDAYTAYKLTSYGMTKDTYLWVAFEMSVDEQQLFIGNQISAVNFMSGSTSSYTWPTGLDYRIFVTDDLSELPTLGLAKYEAKAFNYNTGELATPFEITGEKPIYVGYRFKLKTATQLSNLYVLPVDGVTTDNKSCLYYLTTDKNAAPVFVNSRGVYQNLAPQMGSACVQAVITGNNLPAHYIQPASIVMDNYFQTASRIKYDLNVNNRGTEDVSSVVVRTTIDNGTEYDRTINLSTPIESGTSGVINVTNVPNTSIGQFTLSSKIIKINGEDVPEIAQLSLSADYSSYDDGWPRKVVIEEGTGNWCGYCPQGIWMMETAKSMFPDMIRIAAHYSGGDPMQCDSYYPWMLDFGGSFPAGVANRLEEPAIYLGYSIAPSEYLTTINEYYSSFPSYADVVIDAQCSEDDNYVTVNASTQFSITPKAEHQLAFVITEDNVGPYEQENYYAGGGKGPCNGWESKGSSVSTMYEDVARLLDGYPGIEGSLPTTINPQTPYSFTRQLSLANVTNGKFKVAALIVNSQTNEIINARQIEVYKTGVKGIENDNAPAIEVVNGEIKVNGADVAVYSLDGRRVANSGLANGVYIISVDGKSYKVHVK